MQERVQFFSKSDLSLSYFIHIAEQVVEEYLNGRNPQDINDYLEMYHIILFVDNDVISDKWNEEVLNEINKYPGQIIRYMNSLTVDTISAVYSSVIPQYTSTFWKVVERYNIKGLINQDVLEKLFPDNSYALRELLECERLVKENGRVIADMLRKNKHTPEWLLASYVEDDRFGNKKQIYIPDSLSIEEKDSIISDYIDRPNPNINYIRLIEFAKNSKNFKLSDKTRLKAQQKDRELNQQILSGGNGMKTMYTVRMSDDANAPIKDAKLESGVNPTFTYSSKFLLKQDIVGLLRYCAQVFEFITPLGFISLIYKQSESDALERIIGTTAQNTYPTGVSFRFKEIISWLQTEAMENVLQKNGRSIQSMLKKFYETYLPDKLGYHGLNLDMPSNELSWRQKCVDLLLLMENVAKQFTAFVDNGEIDSELVSIMSPMKVTDIPSSIKQKYYVIKGQPVDLWHLFHLFFSDQCMLTFVDPYKNRHYHCFYDLLSQGISVNYNNYRDYQQRDIDYLKEQGYLSVAKDGTIKLEKPKDLLLLKQLYEYKACPFWYYDTITQSVIRDMVKKGWLEVDNHLLTPGERDYFSYYLNNQKFTNGPAIRNRYMHGAMMNVPESEHRKVYFRILNLFIILIIKMSEDLTLRKALVNKDVQQDKGYSYGTTIRLCDIASVLTNDQLKIQLKDTPNLKFVAVPKKFWFGEGNAEEDSLEIMRDGYAIITKSDYLVDFFRFYINSGIVRVALSKADVNNHIPLEVDDVRSIPLTVISERHQSACILLDLMISASIDMAGSDSDKMNFMRRDLLLQMKEFICMEIMNPEVIHGAGIILLDPVTDLIAELLDITDINQRTVSFVDKIVFEDNRSIMSTIKRARVVAKSASDEMNKAKK